MDLLDLLRNFQKNLNKMVATKRELIDELSRIKPILQKEHGVAEISIFGSFARDTMNPESDVDLFIDMNRIDYNALAGVKIYLENLLERNVDIVRKRKQINPLFLKRIQKDIVHV
ncbi:MAG: nucleotidyltransferase domain-containing protein [Leptospiraceae bacterium]|jgi:predicted nucleotidyltransferase|nr:nucleotidyltransferase domain-containing protein [Leptospiraceae bacterium]MCZ8347151.1 nucleotidyltransferase domain-containing protein [Leptospiraceae bacterium]